MATLQINDLMSIFDSKTKDERITEFKEDPLVLAVSLKTLQEQGVSDFWSLEDPRVLENITEEIRDTAQRIRKYYGKKYFWSNLTNNRELSGFRSRTCYLLENRIRSCKDKDAGIYYKLPYFYDEDMIYDDFKKQYNTTDIPRIGSKSPRDKIQLTLKYVKSTSSRQQKRNINRFWFTDDVYLFGIEVANDNPLLELFNQLIVTRGTVTFDTLYSVDRIDQMYYYKLFNFSLAKEQNEIS